MSEARQDPFFSGVQAQLLEGPWFWAVTALLLVALSVPVLVRYPMNHDIGAHVDLASRVLDGERLYTDILEPNPPLIVYVYAAVVAIARAAGARPYVAMHLFLVAFNVLCALVTYRAMEAAASPASRVERRVLLWVLLFLYVAFPGYDFGNRDPLVAAATLPYVVCAAGRARGRAIPLPLALAAGALAAFGFALKPYFALLWLLVEGYLFFGKKLHRAFVRPENLVVMGFVAVYAAHVAFGTDYLANLKLVMFSYENYENSLELMLAVSRPHLWLPALLLLLAFREPEGDRELRLLLLFALLAFLYSGFAQKKGWEYHFVPLRVTAVLVIAIVLLGATREEAALARLLRSPRALGLGIAGTVLFLAAANLQATLRRPDAPSAPLIRLLAQLQREHAAGQRVLWVTSMADPAYPSMDYAGVQGAHTLGTFPLARLYAGVKAAPDGTFPYRAPAEMSDVERKVVEGFLADVSRKPALVIFDRRRYRLGFGDSAFEYEAYFFRDPRIREFMMRNYEPLSEVAGFRLYKLRGGVAGATSPEPPQRRAAPSS